MSNEELKTRLKEYKKLKYLGKIEERNELDALIECLDTDEAEIIYLYYFSRTPITQEKLAEKLNYSVDGMKDKIKAILIKAQSIVEQKKESN